MHCEQSNAALQSGVWSYPDTFFEGQMAFVWIDEARRRIVSFHVVSLNPLRRIPMRIWYMQASATSILAGLHPLRLGLMHEYRFEGDTLIWMHPEGEQAWRYLPQEEWPEWLASAVEKAYAKMDAD